MMKFVLTLLTLTLILAVAMAADPTMTQETVTDSYQNTANKDSSITWASIPDTAQYSAGDTTYDAGGMKPMYSLTRSFINSVFPGGMPWETISKALNGTLMTDITSNYSSYITSFAGWGACVVIGFLFIIFFTMVGCCFCCCRCCGNCGGKMLQKDDDAHADCRRRTYSIILLVLVAFQASGMACVFVSNDRFTTAIESLDSSVTSNLNDVEVYTNSLVDQIKYVAQNNFNFTLDVVTRDLESIGYLLGIPVRTSMKAGSNFDTAISSAQTLATTSESLLTAFQTMNTSLNKVKESVSNLSSDLTQLSADITTTQGKASCVGCSLATNNLKTDINTANFPDTDSQMSSISAVTDKNLTQVIEDAQTDMTNIPWRIHNETTTTIGDVTDNIRSFSDKLDPAVNEVTSLKDQFNLGNLTSDVSDYMTTAKKYNEYRWYGGIVLACFILIIVVLEALGLLFAAIGHDTKTAPTERGCMSNSGGNMFMAAVGFIFIFSWLLMLLTTITFLLGSPLERFVCQPLTDPDLSDLNKVVDEYGYQIMYGSDKTGTVLGELLHNGSIDIHVSELLLGCQSGKTAYSILKLNETFNITAYTNFRSTLDFDSTIQNVATDVNLDSFSILTTDLVQQFDDLKSAVNVDFDTFRTELSNAVTAVNLTEYAEQLRALAAQPAVIDPAMTELNTHATTAETIRDTTHAKLITDIAELESSLESLEMVINGSANGNALNLTQQVDQVVADLNVTEQFIKVNGSTVITNELTSYTDRIFAIVDSYVTNTLSGLDTTIGKCTPIWNLYNGLIVVAFCGYSIETLNGFWFSMGWVLFFFVPSVIFAVKLAKHYRKMKYIDTYDQPVRHEKHYLPEVRSHGNRVSPAGMSLTNLNEDTPKLSRKSSQKSKTSCPSPTQSRCSSVRSHFDEKPIFKGNKVAHSDDLPPKPGYQAPSVADDW